MKPFKFTLHAVQTLREEQERKAQENYARSLRLRDIAAQQLACVDAQIAEDRAAWHERNRAGMAAGEAIRFNTHFLALEESRRNALKEIERADRAVNAAFQEMLRRRQAREGIDKLFEKQHAAYEVDVARVEQQSLDEMANRRNSLAFQQDWIEVAAV